MDINDIVRQCRTDSAIYFPSTSDDIGHMTLALCGETGELANVIKKIHRGSLSIEDEDVVASIAGELADILIYLANMIGLFGFDASELYKLKRQFNNERFLDAGSNHQPDLDAAVQSDEPPAFGPTSFIPQRDV